MLNVSDELLSEDTSSSHSDTDHYIVITIIFFCLALQPCVGRCLLHKLCRFRKSRFFSGWGCYPTSLHYWPSWRGRTYQELTLPPAFLSGLLERIFCISVLSVVSTVVITILFLSVSRNGAHALFELRCTCTLFQLASRKVPLRMPVLPAFDLFVLSIDVNLLLSFVLRH
jgi:hypothetical protein